MNLYATTTSERASKGQGGNDFVVSNFNVKEKNVLDVRLEITADKKHYNLIVMQDNKIILFQNKKLKGEKQKTARCNIKGCIYNTPCILHKSQ